MNTIYLKTDKAERESYKLSVELKRVLSLLDGRSGSEELAMRAAPSLRKYWSELISELVKEGYIDSSPVVNIEPNKRALPRSGADASVRDLAYHNLRAAEQVIAELEAAAAADKARSDYEAKRKADAQQMQEMAKPDYEAKRKTEALQKAEKAKSEYEAKRKTEAQQKAEKAKSDFEAKRKADAQQQADKDARAAELKTFFATAKEKAASDIKQSQQEAARVRAELLAAAAAKEKLDAEAVSNAEVNNREQENERAVAEFEEAIHAAKTRTDIEGKAKSELISKNEMHVNDTHHLSELKIENEALKKLLVESYVEIAALKSTLGTMR